MIYFFASLIITLSIVTLYMYFSDKNNNGGEGYE